MAEALGQPRGASASLSALLETRFGASDLKLTRTRPARSLLAGNQRTRVRGRGMDFEEVRHYHPGDDVRSIDWRVTARTEIPHTKVYREERERPALFLCDMRESMAFGSVNCFKSVTAAHICASLSWATLAAGDKIGSVVFNETSHHEIRPKRSKNTVLSSLQQLCAYSAALLDKHRSNNGTSQQLSRALNEIRRVVTPGFNVYIVSDFYDFDDAAERELSLLARHASITLFHVYDPLEHNLKSRGPLTISNGHEHMSIPAHTSEFQTYYAAQFDAKLDHLTQTANRLGIPLISISTADNLPAILHRLFGRKG